MVSRQNLEWNWSSQWHLYGDSIAGKLFRFVYANAFSSKEIAEMIIASPSIQQRGSPLYHHPYSRVDWQRFCSRTGLSEGELRLSLLGDLLDSLSWTPVTSQRFRFCPACLQSGYHARYFQIAALALCPIHGAGLRDTCPACHAPTPFYGICRELLSTPYCCWKCGAYFAGKRATIQCFFHPEVAADKFREIWQPLDKWIERLEALELGFATLRDWVIANLGEHRLEREVEALHMVGTVLPLPGGNFSWLEPRLRRKSFFCYEGGRSPRSGMISENYLAEAYVKVRAGIAKKLSLPRVVEILKTCRVDSWRAVTNNGSEALSAKEVAYILWRIKFENLSEPALVGMDDARQAVFISDDIVPFSWRNLGQSAWKILFWAAYRGMIYDVEEAIRKGANVADLHRDSPTRQCCFLPSTNMRGKGRGVVVYPQPRVERVA